MNIERFSYEILNKNNASLLKLEKLKKYKICTYFIVKYDDRLYMFLKCNSILSRSIFNCISYEKQFVNVNIKDEKMIIISHTFCVKLFIGFLTLKVWCCTIFSSTYILCLYIDYIRCKNVVFIFIQNVQIGS